ERPIEAVEVRAEGDERSDAEAPADHHQASPSVDEGGGEGGDHAESAPEHAVVHGRLDADVTDAPGAICEHLGLLFGTSEELDEKGTGHVEPVGHGLAHGGVELVPLPGHGGEL